MIWNGNDYLPVEWDDLRDSIVGRFLAEEFAGNVVGVIKSSAISTEQWSLEGLRGNIGIQR
jgi:predicted molibdopterin-dependent oxidoreductase YjgC